MEPAAAVRRPEGRVGGPVIEPYRAPETSAWIGDLALVVSLGVAVFFLHLAHVLKLHQRDTWWASNVRDAVNLLAVLSLFGAITWQGFALPIALLLAATITLLLTVVMDALAPHVRHPAWGVLAAAVAVALPLLFAPARSAEAVNAFLAWAFGGF
jgi:hypothetical protein